ncbi:hypothetical protein [Allorhodopirellula heiligendammensis]|uniref:Uncharacterized protein n=1 Tax=Allorhodopirellula heiligendammensis TaxID=2714739 RepID=A0A5C6BIC6_9BACT|nr:hypothetical protein [Allorhodopirellula heiligendammensis]TWU10204.1 hypothetical protein Poly21_51740 [Allorhodopirellula heiligendammensis]
MTVSRRTRSHSIRSASSALAHTPAVPGQVIASASKRWIGGMLCVLMLLGGCRLCADCDDDAYPSYGGIWQRTNRDSGRVGSIFDPGGSRQSDLSQRAESDGEDTANRFESNGGSGNLPADGAVPSPSQNGERDIMDTDGLEPPEQPSDEDLRELEQRYRDLKLEEINHRRPPVNAGQWQ